MLYNSIAFPIYLSITKFAEPATHFRESPRLSKVEHQNLKLSQAHLQWATLILSDGRQASQLVRWSSANELAGFSHLYGKITLIQCAITMEMANSLLTC